MEFRGPGEVGDGIYVFDTTLSGEDPHCSLFTRSEISFSLLTSQKLHAERLTLRIIGIEHSSDTSLSHSPAATQLRCPRSRSGLKAEKYDPDCKRKLAMHGAKISSLCNRLVTALIPRLFAKTD